MMQSSIVHSSAGSQLVPMCEVTTEVLCIGSLAVEFGTCLRAMQYVVSSAATAMSWSRKAEAQQHGFVVDTGQGGKTRNARPVNRSCVKSIRLDDVEPKSR